jgi:hypothetical protein
MKILDNLLYIRSIISKVDGVMHIHYGDSISLYTPYYNKKAYTHFLIRRQNKRQNISFFFSHFEIVSIELYHIIDRMELWYIISYKEVRCLDSNFENQSPNRSTQSIY